MNEHNPKIYLLPNLMTAGNLFCGFAAKSAVLSPQTREAAVEHIENASTENKPDGSVKKRRRFIRTGPLNERALHDLKRSGEPAKQIARRHQVGQQINLWMVFVHSGNRAITLAPPFT